MTGRGDAAPEGAPLALTAVDGRMLGATRYGDQAASRTVLISGATAVPQGYYRRFATWLASNDVEVLTFDYRGVGRSVVGHPRDDPATATDWGLRDASAAFDEAASWGRPVTVLGHSFGGQALGLCPRFVDAAAIVLVASQTGWWRLWPRPARYRMWFVATFGPWAVRLFGYAPGWLGLGEDLPPGVVREWLRWWQEPDYLVAFVDDAGERYASYEQPVLALSFADDELAPADAVHDLLRRLTRARVEHRALTPADTGGPVGHFGFFKHGPAESLWPEVLRFARQHGEG